MTTPVFPIVWYWVVGDHNPTTQVWEGTSGGFIANNSANYQSWIANGGSSFGLGGGGAAQNPVTNAANNGAGLIRLTLNSTVGMVTGDAWVVQGVGGTTEANGTWLITVVGSTTVDLQGSAFVHAYTGGGVIDRGIFVDTFARVCQVIDTYNQTLPVAGYLAVTSGVNYQMLNSPPIFFDFGPTAGALTVTLPQMNLFGSAPKGQPRFIHNSDTVNSFVVNEFSGGDTISIAPRGYAIYNLLDNSSPAGSVAKYPVLSTIDAFYADVNTSLALASVGQNASSLALFRTSVALTAPRTWTLPSASTAVPGSVIYVADYVGGVSSTNTLSIVRAGGDLINGSNAAVVLRRPYDFLVLQTNGVSDWIIVGRGGATPGSIEVTVTGVNLNSVGDTAVNIPLPAGVTNYRVQQCVCWNASVSLTNAFAGLFTAVGGGGIAIIPSTALSPITATTVNTSANAQALAPVTNLWLNLATLQLRNTVAQGSAATANFTFFIQLFG